MLKLKTFEGTVLSREDMKKIQGGKEPAEQWYQCANPSGGSINVCAATESQAAACQSGYNECTATGPCFDAGGYCPPA